MLTFYRSVNSPAGLNAWRLLDFSAVPGPPGALPPTPSGGTPTTEEEADTRAEAPSGEVIGNTNVFISGASANTSCSITVHSGKTSCLYIHLCGVKIWFIRRKVKDS
jgi:hypothetical protein